MDSVTRFALAQREVGLAAGEPPARAGTRRASSRCSRACWSGRGPAPASITALYTVLVEGGDMDEPIADATRAILDGHMVLTAWSPAPGATRRSTCCESVSRLVGEIVTPELALAGQRLRSALAVLREKEDLVAIGAYQPGSDPALDTALAHRAQIEDFLRQSVNERSTPEQADTQLLELAASLAGEATFGPEDIPDGEEVTAERIDPGASAAANVAAEVPAIPALGLSI